MKKVLLVLVGVGVAALGVGIWALNATALGEHITKCGTDAQGPYAEVRVTSIKGALGKGALRQVNVLFAYDNRLYDQGESTLVKVNRFDTYGRLHGTYPPRHLGRNSEITVQGRTVYRTPWPVLLNPENREEVWPGKLVSKARIERIRRMHPHSVPANPKTEVVPDDLSKIRCTLYYLND